ncbi:hypothetical protein DdX_14980 [Ditylenchus destructor]|uniref:Uncharacterized protein n=1 Tax=Ditylenchus destructor TaxID=166010 RepID=A0AAD4QY55_9BILA|nr:hypothetical protein DdX_14980 [Ditylenchus destructor]
MEQQRIAWLDPNEETGDANTKRKTVLADLTYYITEETSHAGKVTTRMTTEIKYQLQPGVDIKKTATATVKWVKVRDQTPELVVEVERLVKMSIEKKAERDRVEKEKREADETNKAAVVKKSTP